jgi:hypothetical protein
MLPLSTYSMVKKQIPDSEWIVNLSSTKSRLTIFPFTFILFDAIPIVS